MDAIHFTNVDSKLNGNDVRFTCESIPLVFVNGIRRMTMNSIPIAGFRDEPPSVQGDDRSVSILQNHTLLYNEMLVTRIALLPLFQTAIPHIMSKWNDEDKKREFYFERQDTIPVCSLEVKEQEPGLYDITTDLIQVKVGDDSMDSKDVFVRDLTTGEAILLHSLMFPYPSVEVPFAFVAKPVIGTGKEHSSFTPVGTTGMRFVEDEDRVEHVLKTWMENKAREREEKGLTPLSTMELDIMKKNFMLLEKQRIYKQDRTGPTHIELRVESNGSLPSAQLVRESLRMMAVHVCDLRHTLTEADIHTERHLVIVDVGKVDHTVVQCLVEAWKLLPIVQEYSLPSYELTHPLKEQMRMHLRVVDDSKPVDIPKIMESLRVAIAIVVDDISYLLSEWTQTMRLTQTRPHSTMSDAPTHWNWIETLPLQTVSLLPRRPPRSEWKIESSLLRSGS